MCHTVNCYFATGTKVHKSGQDIRHSSSSKNIILLSQVCVSSLYFTIAMYVRVPSIQGLHMQDWIDQS